MEPNITKVYKEEEFKLDISTGEPGHKKVLTFIDTACRILREKAIKKAEDRSAYYATNYLNLLFEGHPMAGICETILEYFHVLMLPLTTPTKRVHQLLQMAHSEMKDQDFAALEANFSDAWKKNWAIIQQAVSDKDVGPRTTLLSQIIERAPKHDDTRLFAYRTRHAALLTPDLEKTVATITVNTNEFAALSAIFFIPKQKMAIQYPGKGKPVPVKWSYKLPFALVAHDKEHFFDVTKQSNYCAPLTFRLYRYGGYCKKESSLDVFQLQPMKADWYTDHWQKQPYDPTSLRGVLGQVEHDLIFPSGLDDEVCVRYKQYGLIYKLINELVEFCGQITMSGNSMFSHVPDFFKELKQETIAAYLKRMQDQNQNKKAAVVSMEATQSFEVAKQQNLALIARLTGQKRNVQEAELKCNEELKQDVAADTESEHELKLEDLLADVSPGGNQLVDQLAQEAPKITTRSAAKKGTQ